jgi:redox-sensing transcriptional repressor
MVLVGVGQLGRAILGYAGFIPQGFRIIAAFDAAPSVVGTDAGGLIVEPVSDLPRVLRENPVDIAIVAVPGASAQQVIDTLVANGVKAILNYAPIAPQVPSHVRIRDIDPVLALQSMTFYIKDVAPSAK